jgi:GNAT superfamily N-acetyltransferase
MTKATQQEVAEVTIRLARREDAAAIHSLVVELARARRIPDKVESSISDIERDGFGAAPAFEALLAERGGEAVGLSLFFPSYSTWRGQRGVYLQDLVVAEGARGLGVGERLLAATAALCHQRGGGYLRLSVDDDNAAARAFYQRCGLTQSKSEIIQVIDRDAFVELAARTGDLSS